MLKRCAVGFAICKLSEGTGYADPAFDRFYAEAELPLGAYVYSRALSPDAARAEARKALSLLRARPLALGVFLDVEEPRQLALSREALSETAAAFCALIREAGYRAGVYGSELGAWAKLERGALGDALVWVANWSARPAIDCDLWQYSSDTRLEGYGPVDGDEALSARVLALLGAGSEPAQPGAPSSGSFSLTGVPLLRYGDRGDAVKALQGELIAFGYPCGGTLVNGAERPDGIFGPQTQSSVLAYQRARSLAPDGVVGALTRGALLGAGE